MAKSFFNRVRVWKDYFDEFRAREAAMSHAARMGLQSRMVGGLFHGLIFPGPTTCEERTILTGPRHEAHPQSQRYVLRKNADGLPEFEYDQNVDAFVILFDAKEASNG